MFLSELELPEILDSRCIDVRGWPMHYIASVMPVDPVPPVVLVHGVGLSFRYMVPTAERLAEHFHVYIPDFPGFGKSYKPERVLTIPELADWLIRWMDAMELDRAALLGNSVGCQIIVDAAARYPGRVARAVLQGPTCDPQARSFPQQMWRWYRNRNAERSSDKGPMVARDYWECGPGRLVKTFRHALDHPIEELLPHVRCPTLVVRGLLDPIVPQRWAEEVARLLPDGSLLVIPGCPHTANLEAPLELTRIVRPFFEEERRLRNENYGRREFQEASQP